MKSRLKLLRKANRIEQKELAIKSGIKITRLRYIEKDFTRATPFEIKSIAKSLNITLENLLA